MKKIIIGDNDVNKRIDNFLSKYFNNIPKSLIYKHIRKKNIKVNGKKTLPNYKTLLNDEITIYLNDDLLLVKEDNYDFIKAPKKLNIVYEDENLILINKKPGIIIHPDKNYHFDSLISRIKHYLYSKNEYDPSSEQSFAPAFVNRIDRNTGGLVIAAKNMRSLQILNDKFAKREIDKYYLCKVKGIVSKNEDLISAYLYKDEDKNKVYIKNKEFENSKKIETQYRVIKRFKDSTLLEIKLLTGRTHQIRAHMAFIGHPILGDTKYGSKSSEYKYQALYSYKILFNFTTDASMLNYLNKKINQIPLEDIWFINDTKL